MRDVKIAHVDAGRLGRFPVNRNGPAEKTARNEGHVRHTMFKTAEYKHHNREEQPDDFAGDILRRKSDPDGDTDQKVTENAFQKSVAEGQ